MRNKRNEKGFCQMEATEKPTPSDEREKVESQTNEMILAEDAVETTIYLAAAPDCCSPEEKLVNMLGMLGSNICDEDIYHSENDHINLKM